MTRRLLCCLIFLISIPAHSLENQLSSHPSPYLALHGNDPVAWQSWGTDALLEARAQGKLLYVSVGYFSCHWCHVMQRESYRDSEIAVFLNQHFVPVKVDRELEPALDRTLMDFTQQLHGRGGWPHNVFLTPEGYPLYSVLYLPPVEFLTVLQQLNELWLEQSERLTQIARQVAPAGFAKAPRKINRNAVKGLGDAFARMALAMADDLDGGFGEENKFPQVPQLEYLLRRFERSDDPVAREVLERALDAMAGKSLRDHLGGGFFRYTVDPGWETPHFEKMLYDNALLARLYLRASFVLARADYRMVARETLDFIAGSMGTVDGAMIAAFSAVDANGVEGGYYLWRREQLQMLLTPAEYKALAATWSLERPAAFSAGYLLGEARPAGEVAQILDLNSAEVATLLASALGKLNDERASRNLPADTKLLAGWNGLALSAFAEAAKRLGEDQYRQIALGIRNYLVGTLWNGRELKRAIAGTGPLGTTSLEDYAYTAEGLLTWADLTGREADFQLASELVRAAWPRFFFKHGWRLAEMPLLPASTLREVMSDGALPAPAAVLCRVSLMLGVHLADPLLVEQSINALNRSFPHVTDSAFFFPGHIQALEQALFYAGEDP